jgi:DNA primase
MNNSPIEEIKNRLDILEVVKEYVKLQKSGINYRGLCPFHSEKTPSFFVSSSRQTWHCFGSCSEGGDIFKFIMKIEGIEFGDALRVLAAKAGVQLKRQDPRIKSERQKSYEICEWATRFFEKCLEVEPGKKIEEYLLGRGIKKESIKEWRLGYSLDKWDALLDFLSNKGYSNQEIEKAGLAVKKEETNRYYDRFRGRIMFPIFDFSNQPIGFGGRIFGSDKEAKYLNTPNTIIYDKSKVLYGLNRARTSIRKKESCVLVEGYTDVIMSCQAGVENVVSTSGTALTSYQLEVLKRYSDNLITAFDMDIAGDSATQRGVDMAQERDFNVKVALMPDDLDPADLIAQNPEKWKKSVDQAVSIVSFYLETALKKFNPDVPENKKKIAQIILPVIKKISSDIEQDFWIQELAKKLKVKETSVIEDLKKIKDESAQFGGQEENIIPSTKKSRKDLLEERLLMLVIENSKKLDFSNYQNLSFLSPEACDMINVVFEKNEASPEIKARIDYLSMKNDFSGDSLEMEREIGDCLLEIRIMGIKARLNEISRKMKEAEEKNEKEKKEELEKEFNIYCQKLADIN